MGGIVAGFAAIWTVTAVGFVIGRSGLLGPDGVEVLTRLVFFVAAPALLFTTLVDASPGAVFTPALAVFVLSSLIVAAVQVAVARGLWHRPVGQCAVGAMSASYVNAANLGLPVAAYVLGDVALIAPVLLYQVLLAAPVALAVLDGSSGRGVSWWRIAGLPARNPIMLSSTAGLLVALSGWQPPAAVLRPIELVGAAAVPLALLALGMALVGSRPLAGGADGPDRFLSVALKTVGQPLAAYLIGVLLFGLSGLPLLTAVVTAALPTAQNVFVFASRHGALGGLARDAVVLSTLVAAPVLMVVAAALR